MDKIVFPFQYVDHVLSERQKRYNGKTENIRLLITSLDNKFNQVFWLQFKLIWMEKSVLLQAENKWKGIVPVTETFEQTFSRHCSPDFDEGIPPVPEDWNDSETGE